MGTKFMKDGSHWSPIKDSDLDLYDVLPAGTYTIKQHPMSKKFHLEEIENFDLPTKLYGDTASKAWRILNTFQDRPNATGVLLTGEKGSGKTLLAKTLAENARLNYGIPTIVINDAYSGDDFNRFIQEILQPCIVIFDEFEKVYNREDQEAVLTLLDGVFPTKKLFIFTCNDKYRINDHMTNRPGRIFYMLEYAGLDCQFILEYCNDTLKDTSHSQSVCNLSVTFECFNFDILKALVEEMNRYDENPFEAIKMLNASPTRDGKSKFNIEFYNDGVHIKDAEWDYNNYYFGNPISNRDIPIDWDREVAGKEDEQESMRTTFSQVHLVKLEPMAGKFTYNDGQGGTLILTKAPENPFDIGKFVNSYVM